MSFSIRLTGTEQAQIRIRSRADRVANPGPGLLRIGIYVRDRAIWRIKSSGGDQAWPPHAIPSGQLGVESGRMWQSIQVSQPDAWSVAIGTNVVSKDGFPYPRAFQYGRGPVRAVNARALRFTVGGITYYVKSVGPQPGRRFLLISSDDRARIREIAIRYFAGKEAA